MAMRAKAAAMLRKATAFVSAPFRSTDAVGYQSAFGYDRAGGQPVTIDSAMKLSVIFAGVRLVAQTVATLPCLIYRRKNGGGREVATDHPLYFLLHDSPNADQTAVEFWEEVITSIALRGRAYILKTYNVTGDLISLVPLHPDRMGARRLQRNGTYVYTYNDPLGAVDYTEDQLWIPRGYCDLSVIQYGARSMGAASASENAAAKLFGNDMKPTAVITRDEILTKDQRRQVKEAIDDGMLKSTMGGGTLRLIEGGMKYQQLSLSAEDAQLLESRQFSVEDLCRWIGVPPSMIGHGTAVSNWGTGREQINLSFLQYVLSAYTERLEQGITKWLIKPEERRRIYAEFSVEGLLRADSAGRAAFYSTMAQNGIMTRNEIRTLENWPEVEGGNELTVQSNLVPITLLGQGTTSTDAINNLKQLLGIEDKNNAP